MVHGSHNNSVAHGHTSPRQTPRGVVTCAGSYNAGTTGAGSYNAGTTGAGSYNAGTTGAGSYNAGAREEGGEAGYPPQRSSGSDWASPAGAPGSGPQQSGGGGGGGAIVGRSGPCQRRGRAPKGLPFTLPPLLPAAVESVRPRS